MDRVVVWFDEGFGWQTVDQYREAIYAFLRQSADSDKISELMQWSDEEILHTFWLLTPDEAADMLRDGAVIIER